MGLLFWLGWMATAGVVVIGVLAVLVAMGASALNRFDEW